MKTITLYEYIKSELNKQGLNEFQEEDGSFIFFEEEHQFIQMVLRYEEPVQNIIDKLFTGTSLKQREHDTHFKRAFTSRFATRYINRQTIEAFRLQVLTTFLSNEVYLNELYANAEKYVTQATENTQSNTQQTTNKNVGTTTTDNRQAYAELPQNNVQIDVDNTVMDSANDNTISRNKQTNDQETTNQATGETSNQTKSYQLNELFKLDGLLDHVLDEFDRKCFMQVW